MTPPIWFVDSDDPSLAQVLERLEDVRKGSTLVNEPHFLHTHADCVLHRCEKSLSPQILIGDSLGSLTLI